MTIEKTISIKDANKWLNAIIARAIDHGEVDTHYYTFENSYGNDIITSVTVYWVSENLTIKIFDTFTKIYYYSNKHGFSSWSYNIKA